MASKTVFKVRALVTDDKGRVYAIRANRRHVLQLPGGSMKPGENPRKALRREIREELGYEITDIVKVQRSGMIRNGVREETTFYTCRITGAHSGRKLSAREMRRGLRVKRYRNVEAFYGALSERVSRYGRPACIRDRKLTAKAVGAF